MSDGISTKYIGPKHKYRCRFDRHTPEYRLEFDAITEQLHQQCPVAWSDAHGGHSAASGNEAVFELARCPHIPNDHDVNNERRGYQGITIPCHARFQSGGDSGGGSTRPSDLPQCSQPYLLGAAVKRWEPFIHEVARASIDGLVKLTNPVPLKPALGTFRVRERDWIASEQAIEIERRGYGPLSNTFFLTAGIGWWRVPRRRVAASAKGRP